MDTAQALQIKAAASILADDLDELSRSLEKLAREHKDTVQIGRTHGMHAEPITFGLKVASWWDEMKRHRSRFAAAAEEIRVGKISGAVGTFAHIGPEAETKICARLGLKAAPISSQVLSRDLHAQFLATLAGIASSLDKIAVEIRHLQRTEVREVAEPFAAGQKGSSAMPHKRNPVTCEQISGLARVVRANSQAAFENVPLWHERDISHSSVERVILPDSTILLDYLLSKTDWVISGLVVDVTRMRRNLDSTRGLVFSGQLLLDLAAAGMLREEAYALVQRHAMSAWENESDFRQAVFSDPVIGKFLNKAQFRERLFARPAAQEHRSDFQQSLREFKLTFSGYRPSGREQRKMSGRNSRFRLHCSRKWRPHCLAFKHLLPGYWSWLGFCSLTMTSPHV